MYDHYEFRRQVHDRLRETTFALPFAPRCADVWPGAGAADGIMGRIGADAAADRMRKAYEEAFRAGRIRVR